MEEYCDTLNKTYEMVENEIICTVTEISKIPKIVSSTEKNNLINFLTEVIDGVYTYNVKRYGRIS